MCFIGIITGNKSKKYINKIIKGQIKEKNFEVIYITEKNVQNMKNIRFDTIIINKKVEWLDELQNNFINTKYVIINSDLELDYFLLGNARVITYGFNSKSTITLSSNTEDSVQICVQRNISGKKENIEQQEIYLCKNDTTDIYDIMLLICILLLYNKSVISLLKL